MTEDQAREVIYGYIVTNWTLTASNTYAFENESLETAGLTEYLRFHVRHAGGGQYTLGSAGNRVYRRRGVALSQIFVAVDRGLLRLDELARAARGLFEGNTINGVQFLDGDYRELGIIDGMYQGTVPVAFTYDETK